MAELIERGPQGSLWRLGRDEVRAHPFLDPERGCALMRWFAELEGLDWDADVESVDCRRLRVSPDVIDALLEDAQEGLSGLEAFAAANRVNCALLALGPTGDPALGAMGLLVRPNAFALTAEARRRAA